jgi:hypothetical protein
MLNQIVSHTPVWVWPLLLALIWLGLSQSVTRSLTLKRITITPLVMTGLSLQGTVSAFGADPAVLSVWLIGAALSAAVVLQQPVPAQTRYDQWTQRFTVPGSWMPLLLILGIFVTKYAVGAALGLNHSLRGNTGFSLGVATLYGVFSGIFLARSARLWRLAHRGDTLQGSIVSS